MHYLGPDQADFHNVRALNREFLHLVSGQDGSRPPLAGVPASLARGLKALRPAARERLAETPFLLFSFRERDNDYWGRLLREQGGADLFDVAGHGGDAHRHLIAAGLGYVWQLARQNTYSARLICGASLHWCEQLAERTLLELVAVAVYHLDIIAVRAAGDRQLWDKLLTTGVSKESDIRSAAHICAMQRVLTEVRGDDGTRLPVAARRGLSPALKVADEMDR